MAYVLGLLYADGHLIDAPYMRGKYVGFTSTDRGRVLTFKRLLSSGHRISIINRGGNHKEIYSIRIGSAALYDQLCTLGMTTKKSNIMSFPTMPKEFLSSFVRGYFDGDGCVYLDKNTNGNIKRLLTVFTSGSREFLEQLHSHLVQEIGIEGKGLFQHGSVKTAHQLRYSSRDSLRLFLHLYIPKPGVDLYLERKYAIFLKYLKLRNLDCASIPLVLKKKGPVAK